MRVRLTGAGQERVRVGVLGPQSAQDEDRSAVRGGKQSVQCGRYALAVLGVAEVVLSFVKPYHRAGRHAIEVTERGFGPGRIVGVPQSPPLGGERLDGLPACPRLAGRRRADQHQHPTAPLGDLCHRVGQSAVMGAPHVAGQRP